MITSAHQASETLIVPVTSFSWRVSNMFLTTQLWRGPGALILGSLLLSGASTFGAEDPPLSTQLAELGRQALAQGAAPTARTFFQKALLLDPKNKVAARGLEQTRTGRGEVVQVAMQVPAPAPPAPAADQPADNQATLEQTQAAET